jgi:hypothetical protein
MLEKLQVVSACIFQAGCQCEAFVSSFKPLMRLRLTHKRVYERRRRVDKMLVTFLIDQTTCGKGRRKGHTLKI